MTIFKYFIRIFFKKFIWIHYFVFISLYLVKNKFRLYLIFILLLNLFIQQIKILNFFNDLFFMCKFYGISMYYLSLYVFLVGFILLLPYVKIIGFYTILSFLVTGLIINVLKTFYYESR